MGFLPYLEFTPMLSPDPALRHRYSKEERRLESREVQLPESWGEFVYSAVGVIAQTLQDVYQIVIGVDAL